MISQASRKRPACASGSHAWTFSPAGHAWLHGGSRAMSCGRIVLTGGRGRFGSRASTFATKLLPFCPEEAVRAQHAWGLIDNRAMCEPLASAFPGAAFGNGYVEGEAAALRRASSCRISGTDTPVQDLREHRHDPCENTFPREGKRAYTERMVCVPRLRPGVLWERSDDQGQGVACE